jgi:hypothetical protein
MIHVSIFLDWHGFITPYNERQYENKSKNQFAHIGSPNKFTTLTESSPDDLLLQKLDLTLTINNFNSETLW